MSRTAQQNPRSRALEGPFGLYLLEERFALLPGIAADHTVPAADTYTSAGMQKSLNVNPNFMLVGTNAASAGATRDTAGGVVLTTTTASGDQEIVTPHTASGLSAWAGTNWASAKSPCFEATIVTGANITAETIWAGLKLTNTDATATDADAAYFRYCDTENGGRWQLVIANNSVVLDLDTTVTVTVSTQYTLRIEIDSSLVVHGFINGVEYNPNTSNLVRTGKNLIPYVGVRTNTTSAKNITCRGVRCAIS